ncbi:hypothetical protein HDU96_006370 [Phlyctochytrium bullatum]|nr:hypothetical protein HDU96_006370 [Phlyctochytrium bullatum]
MSTVASPSASGLGPRRILVAATGSVASIKIPRLLELLASAVQPAPQIRLVVTDRSLHFFDRTKLDPRVDVFTDADEWRAWSRIGDPVLHIDLRNWADLVVIAPLDANTLAKLAGGICDNLLTCVMRAWDVSKPVLLCPAMNTHMWNHPLTAKHLAFVTKDLGYFVQDPISKTLACGDTGIGAMAEVDVIARRVKTILQSPEESPGP